MRLSTTQEWVILKNTIKITCTKHTQKSLSDDTNHILVLSALTDKLFLIVQCIFQQTAYFSTWTKVSCSHTSCPCPQVLFCMGRKMDMICFCSLTPNPPSPPPVCRALVLNKTGMKQNLQFQTKMYCPLSLFLSTSPCLQIGTHTFKWKWD